MIFDKLLNLVSSDKALDIRVDSRVVKDGDIFVAIKGTVYDGHDFIDQAIANGARYIVCQQDRRQKPVLSEAEGTGDKRQRNCEIIFVEDSSEAAAHLAQAARGNPALRLINLSVTGTNGKTTVAYLVRSVIQSAGEKCGIIGTIIYDTGSDVCESMLTTPDCLDIARIQQQIVKTGTKYMVIEASSHALSQNRLAGINFKAAAFTNLAGDHLDYHKTKEQYLAAKTKLFSALSSNAVAVLNKQSPQAKYIAEKTKANILWYAIDESADITAYIESMDINETVFALDCSGFNSKLKPVPSGVEGTQNSKLLVKTPLLGRYNVSNHLAAAGLCLAAGFDFETIVAGLSALKVIPGRLEKVNSSSYGSQVTGHVFIDYAHTDDALKNVLATFKPLCKNKLIVVFGCGGDRDRTKRPRMAKVSEELADIVIVTSDNPRTEKPEDIINEIVTGFENGPTMRSMDDGRVTSDERRVTKIIEPDRRRAIELAIKTAGKNDIVLIAGKGHESYQIIGTKKFHFSDRKIAEECLTNRVSFKIIKIAIFNLIHFC